MHYDFKLNFGIKPIKKCSLILTEKQGESKWFYKLFKNHRLRHRGIGGSRFLQGISGLKGGDLNMYGLIDLLYRLVW